MSVQVSLRALVLLLGFVLLVVLQSCTAGGHISNEPAGQSAGLDSWLEEVDNATAPLGVDNAVFAQLKAELRRILLARATDKAPIGESNMAQDLVLSGSDSAGWTLSWSYLNTGDYNLDSQVTVADLTPIGIYFGRQAGEEGWLEASVADGDGNQRITVADLTPIGLNFRASVGGFNVYGGDSSEGPWNMVGAADLPDLKATTEISFALAARDYEFYCIAPIDLQDAVGVMSPPSMAEPEVVLAAVDSITPWQSASIGPAGGSLSGPGVGSGPISASIPAGALSESSQVTLGLADGSVSVGGVEQAGSFVYLCGEPPLQLALPAQITAPFTPDAQTVYLPYALTTAGQLLPLSFDEAAYDSGSLRFELRTLYPEPLQASAAANGDLPPILLGIAFLVRQNREAVREDIRYACNTKFDPVTDGFSFNEPGLSNVLRTGQESFAAWYFRNYRASMGPLAQRFKDPKVQLKIATRAMASTLAKLGASYATNSSVASDQVRSFDMVKAAMRLSGPVMVNYKEGNVFDKPFLAYAYRANLLWLYDADKPGGKHVGLPLAAGNSVRLLGDGSLQTYESFENILLDATADPPFGGSDSATINITSHQPGDRVEASSVIVSGYAESSFFLVNGLYFWNTREPREKMHYCTVPESGDFALELPLLPGENRFVIISLGYAFLVDWGVPYTGICSNNLEDEVFWLLQGEEPLPSGWLRFSVDWESYFPAIPCPANDPKQPYLAGTRTGIGTFYATFQTPGSLDSAPFALWEDKSFYTGGQAFSGTYNMTVSDVQPGTYVIAMDTEYAAYNLHRITRIRVSGVATGDFTMEDGHAGPNTSYTGVTYDATTGVLTKVDKSYPVVY